jgi:hypothetical protein
VEGVIIFQLETECCTSPHRRGRETVAEREADSMNSEEMIKKKEAEAEQRRKDSHDLVAESIKKELAESMSVRTQQVNSLINQYLTLQRKLRN